MAKILLVIPNSRFRDKEYISVSEILKSSGHEVAVGSSHHTEAQGHFGLIVKPDINISFVEDSDYDALVFIGGRGVEEYFQNGPVLQIIRKFFEKSKIVAALGMAVELFIYANIIAAKRVTCDNSTITKVQHAGAYYTGSLVQEDGRIITGSGLDSREEFAKTVVLSLEYQNRLKRYENAGTTRSRNYKK